MPRDKIRHKNRQTESSQLHSGNLHTRAYLRKVWEKLQQEPKNHLGVSLDKLILLIEASSKLSTRNHSEPTVITQEISWIIPIQRWRIKSMNLRKLYFFSNIFVDRMGTTKVTNQIPGYCGYIPRTDLNPLAMQHASGASTRNTIVKNNIVENY